MKRSSFLMETLRLCLVTVAQFCCLYYLRPGFSNSSNQESWFRQDNFGVWLQDLVCRRNCWCVSGDSEKGCVNHTIEPSVVWLNVRFLHSTVLNNESVTLGAIAAKDWRTIKGKIEAFGERQTRVRKEANLRVLAFWHRGDQDIESTYATWAWWVQSFTPCFHPVPH